MSSIWLADGTFKTVPALFYHLYTVHCLVGGPNPSKMVICYLVYTHYSQTRCNLNTLGCGILSVKHIRIHSYTTCLWTLNKQQIIPLFNLALDTSESSPFSTLSVCEFALTMRMLPALVFVPLELIEWSFEQLIVAFPDNAYNLCRYFEEN